MKTDYEKLTAYYTSDCMEPDRLSMDQAHTIEYITTMHLLRKYLPGSCTILDCCAGGGKYAFALAKAGYRVSAGDLMQKHVDILNSSNKDGLLEYVYQGNVLNMPQFSDNTFDAVLCMGALYHLHEPQEKEKCVSECLRVLKKDGIFVFAYINRNAVFISQFKADRTNLKLLSEIWSDAQNNIFDVMDFGEPQALAGKFPLDKLTDAGVDGLIYPLQKELSDAAPEEFDVYMKYHLATCEQPSIIGHSPHGLWIGRKR